MEKVNIIMVMIFSMGIGVAHPLWAEENLAEEGWDWYHDTYYGSGAFERLADGDYITYESLKFEGEQASKCINTEETKGICPQGYSYNNQNNECVKVSDTGIGIT